MLNSAPNFTGGMAIEIQVIVEITPTYYGQPMFIFDHTCCYGNAHSHLKVCIEVTFLRSGPTYTQEKQMC